MEFPTMRNIYNGMIDAHLVHCASPRHGVKSRASDYHPPVCARFARLDWGYEAFSLSEAVNSKAACLPYRDRIREDVYHSEHDDGASSTDKEHYDGATNTASEILC